MLKHIAVALAIVADYAQVLITGGAFARLLTWLQGGGGNGPMSVFMGEAVDLGSHGPRTLYQLVSPPLVPRLAYLSPVRNLSLLQVRGACQ